MKTSPVHTKALAADDIAAGFDALGRRDSREHGRMRLAAVLAGGKDPGRSAKERARRRRARANLRPEARPALSAV